jgi:hypothetical protein
LQGGKAGKKRMQKGYEKTYDWVKGLLKNCDFFDSAKRLGLTQISEDTLALDFLGRSYQITKEGIELVGQKTIWAVDSEGYEFNLKSVLGYYALSDANVEPVYEYCAMELFSGGVFRESSSWLSGKNFADTFGKDYEKFKKVMNVLGMEYEEGNRDGKYSWKYKILPKIPAKFIVYEGDDEYPSKLQILYDKNVIKIYNFEQLAVLHVSIFQAILSMGK